MLIYVIIMSLTNDEYEYEYELLDWISVELLNWEWLSANPNAIDLLKKNRDKINWYRLSGNSAAFDLIELDKIDWNMLSTNTNPKAIKLLKESYLKGQNNINWALLSKNSSAIEVLRENPDKIEWLWFIENPVQ